MCVCCLSDGRRVVDLSVGSICLCEINMYFTYEAQVDLDIICFVTAANLDWTWALKPCVKA